jgi:hypothetical protein
MKSLKNIKPLEKQALKKIKGGMVTINGVQLSRAAVKPSKLCSDSLPCDTGFTCYANRCL